MTRAVFLDRDGVINRKLPEGQYITCWEDFQFLPGVVEGIAELNRAGIRVIVVTNQRCVAKGLLSEAELNRLHAKMSEELAHGGARIDGIYYCPHDLDAACDCRKPAPGMLLEAARSHHLDLAASWMIGDSASDIQAGRAARCRTVQVLESSSAETGYSPMLAVEADIIAASLIDAVRQILRPSQS
jgi:D-glycero-D-manno-heptose 1,7-bisphosphate phosphatase